jgi:hypothetical protein
MTMRWRGGARRLAGCCALLAAGAALASCADGSGGNSAGSNSPASTSPASASPASASPAKASPASSPGRTKIIGIARFALPPPGQGCTGARRLPGGGTSIPVTVSTRQSQVAAMANVCINGKGPFPFIIDTGAQGSVVTTALATRLGLPKIGPPVRIGGAGCSASAQVSMISTWNVAGLALQPQYVTYLKIPLFGGRGQPDGLLGSDVWSRFGAMRLDFARGHVTVPGPEQPGPTGRTTISRPSAAPVPASLLRAKPAATVPMTVTSQPGSTAISVKIRFGTQPPLAFTPDTGASQSAVDTAAAARAGLASAHARVRQGTVCTIAVLPEVRTGPWSVAGHRLRPQPVGVTGLQRTTGVAGLLGADQMSRFGSVIFDYAGGRLVLGAG